MFRRTCVLAVVLSCLLAGSASASPIYLTPPTESYVSAGAGTTRGDIVTTSADFALTSIGIEAQIGVGAVLTFSAYVWNSSDRVGGSALATGASMPAVGDGTMKFYDLPIAYTLVPGQEYDIGIDFSSQNHPALSIHYYFFNYPAAPFTVGTITVYDGEQAHNGSNSLTPNLRLNGTAAPVVPEPASLLLLGTGLIGAVRAVRKRRG